MLDSFRKGFAVMTPDFTGIGFKDEDLENCKRYCFNGEVIVEATPKRCGFSVRLRFHRKNEWFKWSRFEKIILKFRIFFDWEYCHRYGKKVLYTSPLSYSQTIKMMRSV